MYDVWLSLILSFIVTCISIPVILTIAKEKKLVDVPNDRKIHKTPIPSLGGVGIFGGFMLSCLVCFSFTNTPELQFYMAAALVVFFFGLKDDILIIAPAKKLCGQLIAAFLIIYKGGLHFSQFYGVFDVSTGNPVYGFIFTFFVVILIMNAFNLIDGVDGLAASLGLMVSIFFGTYFLITGFTAYAVLSFSLTGSLAAFLLFNFHPAKIFMGDVGSQIIGMVSAILLIKFITAAPVSANNAINVFPALGFSVLLIPLLDTLRVFVMRARKGNSPFAADRNHIHHILLDKGLSQRNISLVLLVFTIINIMLVYVSRSIGNGWLIFAMSVCYFASVQVLHLLPIQKKSEKLDEMTLFSDEIQITVIPQTKMIRSKTAARQRQLFK